MVRDIGELPKHMQIVRANERVMINTCPAVETFPIRFKNRVLNGFIKGCAWIRRCYGELNCKRV